ncbi:MAG TPA: SigE family RNA polymerase sigma factor [Acidimicrobiia bacterium]|jgi:RNA polymerase sigma-70 factor (sigma-E family)|nr:SigE family RNA polymerase sigma factor [Acidimicrobiia bacterium]
MTQPRAPGEAAAPTTDFAAFYRATWPGAARLAALLTQDARVGEDLAQEAFARVYPKWSRIENPNAYLRTAVVNACRSWQSRRHTERVKLPLVATSASTELTFDLLADAVAELPYRQRAALVLRYYMGLSEAEIADALGCRPGTVKSLTSRALAALRKGIEE